MAKTQLIRKSFNAGELSPELHYRDDLAAYVKGCKKLTNMVPTPYGAVTRRPPFEVLSKIDTALYGVPVRYIPFKFSLTEVFHIVFTDGSGSESTDPTTADLIIFDEFGTQVIFDGNAAPFSALPLTLDGTTVGGAGTLSTQAIIAMATTIYDPADLHELHFINVNDFVYLTCGGKYPVQEINRFYDDNEGGNRWRIREFEIEGLMDPKNTNETNKLDARVESFDSAKTYAFGDVVSAAQTEVAITSSYWEYMFEAYETYWRLVINIPSTSGLKAGDKIKIDDLLITDLSSEIASFSSLWQQEGYLNVGDIISGVHTIVSVRSGTQLLMDLGVYKWTLTNPPMTTTGGTWAKNSGTTNANPFFVSKADNNTAGLGDTTKWKATNIYQGKVTLETSSDSFSPLDVGRLVSMESRTNIAGNWTFSGNGGSGAGTVQNSESVVAQGSVELTTAGGAWSGTLELQESTNAGDTWITRKTIDSSAGSYNGSVEYVIDGVKSMLRVRIANLSDPSNFAQTGCRWTLRELGPRSNHFFKISEYIDAKTVCGITENPWFNNYSDHNWALGVFSGESGYPFSLCIHDERLCLGGSRLQPNTVFASRVNDWNSFTPTTLETSPYTFTIASDSFDTIRSLKSSRQLNVLTDNAENTMGSRDDNAVTSITNISVSSHTNYGSNQTQAIQLADMIWFVMGQGERVRASKYDFASDGQQSIEMSLFASHITESGIKEMSFRRHPFSSLFCLLNNGTGAVLTYEGMQEVRAWATVKTEGNIISAASNYSDTGDIIAGIVERNGSYFLEQFGSVDDGTVFLDNQTTWTDANFDLGQPIEQDDDGNLVVILDDTELTRDVDYTIAGGVLTIPSQLTGDVCIGRRIECRVNPTDISEVAPSGMVKRLTELGLYLLDSGTCNVAINGKPSPFTDGLKWVAGQRESGLFELTTGGDYEQGLDVNITIDNHRHFTLTGLGYRLGISQG